MTPRVSASVSLINNEVWIVGGEIFHGFKNGFYWMSSRYQFKSENLAPTETCTISGFFTKLGALIR